MKLGKFLDLLHDTQEVFLAYEGFIISGEADSLRCMLCEDVYKGEVTDIEAAGNVLKVWVKEAAESGTP